MTLQEMVERIELVADTQRAKIVGDPVRAFEYELAEKEARVFRERNYAEPIPQTVISWMQASGLDRIQATDTTLQMADAFKYALNEIRRIRLVAKYNIMRSSDVSLAESMFYTAIEDLKKISA